MPFVKGQSGNTNGRPAGKPNKKTQHILDSIEKVISKLEKTLEEDIETLEPKERVRLWDNLQEYARPKLQRTELTGKDGAELFKPDLSKLSNDELTKLIELNAKLEANTNSNTQG